MTGTRGETGTGGDPIVTSVDAAIARLEAERAAAAARRSAAAEAGDEGEPGHGDGTATEAGLGEVDEADVDEDGGRREPRPMGFDVRAMNDKWAFVLMGSKAVVVAEQESGPIEDRLRILSVEAFRAWHLNKFTEYRAADGKLKVATWATRWLSSGKRRQYFGIEFFPDPGGARGTTGYLNLWRGFSVVPAAPSDPAERCRYAVFRDHLLTNVCHGDAALFRWIFGWFAHLVQRPRERLGTALVFRGKMGSGKTKIGEVFGSLVAAHYFMVDDPRYVTGQFNAHMASCLLLQAEEAVWAGDKAAEGRLKGLVTSKFQMIEAKGIDPIRIDNFVRLIMTSNEDWVVPAGKDERRFAVLDVGDGVLQDHGYFAELDAEMDSGGREALLADLLAFDLSTVNLRRIPLTKALLEQKFRSLDSVESWWLDRLFDGAPARGMGGWPVEAVLVEALYDDYVATSDKIGVKRRSEGTAFGMKMMKLVPGLRKERRTVPISATEEKRKWHYGLPDLGTCRDAFEAAVGQPVDWGEVP